MSKNFEGLESRDEYDIMDNCKNHPEKAEIFKLAKLLGGKGYPYFFSFLEELKPTPFNDEGDPEKDIDWDTFRFLIQIGHPVGCGLSRISVCFNTEGDRTLLELLDMTAVENLPFPKAEDGTLTTDLSAEAAMEIIEKFFEAHPNPYI